MPLFAVIALRDPQKVKERIETTIPKGNWHEMAANVWLVSFDGTTQNLSEGLGIRAGETGPGVVFLIQNYSGRASQDHWEWIKLHWKPTE